MPRLWVPFFITQGNKDLKQSCLTTNYLRGIVALLVHNNIDNLVSQDKEINIMETTVLYKGAYITQCSSIWVLAKSPVLLTLWLVV